MIRHPNYWLDDGTVLIIVENTAYRLYRSLITRLSPHFFEKCCQTANNLIQGLDSLSCFTIRTELKLAKVDFDALIAHILHDITSADDCPFTHILRLYIVSSKPKVNFQKVHRVAEKQLSAYMQRNPLDIDFSDYHLLENAFEMSDEAEDTQLRSLLRRALYYSYASHDDITFDDAKESASNTKTCEIDAKQSNDYTSKHITGSDALICERVMSQLSEHFSPTLFQPPAALHMQCTDVYAGLWMDQAVQPAFADNGTAKPFMTLRRLRSLDWKRETDGSDGEKSQPCNECLEHMRQQWNDDAQAIWDMIDSWLVV